MSQAMLRNTKIPTIRKQIPTAFLFTQKQAPEASRKMVAIIDRQSAPAQYCTRNCMGAIL